MPNQFSRPAIGLATRTQTAVIQISSRRGNSNNIIYNVKGKTLAIHSSLSERDSELNLNLEL